MTKMSKEQMLRLVKMPDSEIDYSDIPETTDFSGWVRVENMPIAKAVIQSAKQKNLSINFDKVQNILADIEKANTKSQISLRLDNDIVEYYKHKGKKYQSMINNILRAFMVAEKKVHSHT